MEINRPKTPVFVNIILTEIELKEAIFDYLKKNEEVISNGFKQPLPAHDDTNTSLTWLGLDTISNSFSRVIQLHIEDKGIK